MHRITTLERWGMRAEIDFQPDGLRQVRESGFTGVLVNGGSGIGPDMLLPESLATVEPLPDLLPLTAAANQAHIRRRCALLREHGLAPWLMFWGVPGPDRSADYLAAESNRFFDRRTKLEMTAKFHRTPELFGHRSPRKVSWRGSRPLCLSHPVVREFYDNLVRRLAADPVRYEGVIFFPGDGDPEMCDEHCPRCAASGQSLWELMSAHVNRLHAGFQTAGRAISLYFGVWNQHLHGGLPNIRKILERLAPGVGVCMSLSDGWIEHRKSGTIAFDQPWSNVVEPGEMFLGTAELAHATGRPLMVFGEIAQSEVWDPVCHNMPLPGKTLRLLDNAVSVRGVDAVCDFWGHRHPFVSHANLAAMRVFFDAPDGNANPDRRLHNAAERHYGLPAARDALIAAGVDAWMRFEQTVDAWALAAWGQRFSFAIGRVGARGRIYGPLIPPVLRVGRYGENDPAFDTVEQAGRFLDLQEQDREAFNAAAECFEAFAAQADAERLAGAARLARREAANIRLAAELIVSEARFFLAARLFRAAQWDRLREVVAAEIDARERQLVLSGACGEGAGVDPVLVSEDIQNMRLYLSADSYPDVPDEWFHLTACPYTL